MKESTIMKISAVFTALLVASAFFVIPMYRVWTTSLEGKAQLEKAGYTRQIAKLDAEAEVIRAEGVAKANSIVADGLGGAEGYLRYLWIDKVATSDNQIIYVQADSGLPVLEAGRAVK